MKKKKIQTKKKDNKIKYSYKKVPKFFMSYLNQNEKNIEYQKKKMTKIDSKKYQTSRKLKEKKLIMPNIQNVKKSIKKL